MSNTPLKLTLVTPTLTTRCEHGLRHRLPRFQPEEAEEWLKVAETRVKRWRMSDELKYAMILKAFEAGDLSRLLGEEDVPGIRTLDWFI